MNKTPEPHHNNQNLYTDLQHTGFYPELVSDSLKAELQGRQVQAHLIHIDTHFDYDDVHRHITVLALADDVLAAAHLNDFTVDEAGVHVRAQVSTEMIPLRKIATVVVSTVHADPQNYRQGDSAAEVTLMVTWADGKRIDLIPATCPDPDCTADHGLTGTSAREDLSLRVAADAEGQQAVDNALDFSRMLRSAHVACS